MCVVPPVLAGVAVTPPPSGVRMAWESSGSRGGEAGAAEARGRVLGRGWRTGESSLRTAAAEVGDGQGDSGRRRRAAARGRSDPGFGDARPNSGLEGNAGPHLKQGRAAAQVAEPGGGASSPSPRPAAKGEVALKGAGAAG